MAIQTGIFKTPTGPVYNPAQQIERGFDKTTGIITDYLGRKAQDYDQQQAMFSELANNIGEIEANLQQNYAGMQQQAIDSTREWLKENIKSGTRANDPDFQMELGRRIGAIRNAMGNADKIRQHIDLQMKQIEANPYMDYSGKKAAISELFSMAYNPDVLIDKDPIQRFNAVSNKYIDPNLIGRELYNKLSSKGVKEDLYIDPVTGDQRKRAIQLNDLTDPNDLLDENGNVKLKNLTNERASEIINSVPGLSEYFESERRRRFPNSNEQEANRMLLEAMMTPAANAQRSDQVFRTQSQLEAEDIERRRAEQGLKLTDAQISNLYSLAGSRKQYDDFVAQENKDYQRFLDLWEKGSPESVAPYMAALSTKGYKNAKMEKDIAFMGEGQAKSYEDWVDLPLETKKEYMRFLGINTDILTASKGGGDKVRFTDEDFSKKYAYDYFDKVRKDKGQIIGMKYMDSKGDWRTKSIEEFGGVNGFYEFLRSTRYSGKNYIPVDPSDRSQGAVGVQAQGNVQQRIANY